MPDYPDRVVARLVTDAPTLYVMVADTLGELHAALPPGWIWSERSAGGSAAGGGDLVCARFGLIALIDGQSLLQNGGERFYHLLRYGGHTMAMAKQFKPSTDEEWMNRIASTVHAWEQEDSEETAESALTAIAEDVLQWLTRRLRDNPPPRKGG